MDGKIKYFGLNDSKHSLNLIVPKYLNSATFSNASLVILIFVQVKIEFRIVMDCIPVSYSASP
jgi:hypothetical protein